MMKMRMGAPKQKWTAEEEAALRAGVEKYGPGKWRAIQRDSKFGPVLVSRSNVDLKDKWRNLSVSSGNSRVPRSKLRRGKSERAVKSLSASDSEEEEDEEEDDDSDTQPAYLQRKLLGSRYDELVSEAILTLKEPSGSEVEAIAGYIEARLENQKVPSKFRKLLSLKLKSLTAQGKLIKVGKAYKVREREEYIYGAKPLGKGARLRRQEMESSLLLPKLQRGNAMFDVDTAKLKMRSAEEAARLAALAVAEAEAAAAAADQAAREAEAAEAEAEAAEAAAEAAALAVRPRKSIRSVSVPNESVAVAV